MKIRSFGHASIWVLGVYLDCLVREWDNKNNTPGLQHNRYEPADFGPGCSYTPRVGPYTPEARGVAHTTSRVQHQQPATYLGMYSFVHVLLLFDVDLTQSPRPL